MAPWIAEPYRLWSLNDMLRFYAASFTAAMVELGKAEAMLAMVQDDHPGGVAGLRDTVARLVEAVNGTPESSGLPISRSLAAQLERFQRRVNNPVAVQQWEAITALSVEIQNNLIMEMTQPLFMFIPYARRELYEQTIPQFGPVVDERFPDAARDIAAACRCLAVDEWTATVFHLMRVVEHGLREFARLVGVPITVNFEQENWNTIIERVEKQIRLLDTPPRAPGTSERVGRYSEAASQFRYFKDAWRNHVSHSRTHYDEREALMIWNYVRDFVQYVAALN